MLGYRSDLSMTRYNPNEMSVLFTPRNGHNPALKPIIYAHGANGDGLQVQDGKSQTGLTRLFGMVASQGYTVLSADWGGPQTYGNDTELAAMEGGVAFLRSLGLGANGFVLSGGSMGSLSVHRYAEEHPADVAALLCFIPALDIEDLRARNVLSLRNLIEAAWGLPNDSDPVAYPVPHAGRPMERTGDIATIPEHMFYSLGDTVTIPQSVDQYAALKPGLVTKHITSQTADHSDLAIIGTDRYEFLDIVKSYAGTP